MYYVARRGRGRGQPGLAGSDAMKIIYQPWSGLE